jgi:hypothetical protein
MSIRTVIGMFCFFLMAFNACKSQKKVEPLAMMSQEETPIILLLSDNYGGTATPQFQVIKDQSALKKFFVSINRTRKPGLPVPEIDFTRDMVVLYCPGETRDGHIPVLFKKKDMQDSLLLGIRPVPTNIESSNAPKVMPFTLYKMPLTDKAVVLDSLP